MMLDSKLVARIVDVICEVFEETSIHTFDVDGPLSNQVIVDSLKFMELITVLEDKFDIIISDDLLTIENFDGVPQIASVVKGLQ